MQPPFRRSLAFLLLCTSYIQPSHGGECCNNRDLCCQNGGQCRSETVESSAPNNAAQIGQYEHEFCECTEGWGGEDCSSSTATNCCGGGAQEDGTIKPPMCCQNGGTCKSTSSRDFCDCGNSEWGGRHCSMHCCRYRDLCCYNGAKCVEETVGDPEDGKIHFPVESCQCTEGWGGKSCVFPVTVCPDGDTTCYHGAECVLAGEDAGTVGDYACDCSSVEGGPVAGDQCEFNATSTCHEEKPDTHFCTNGGECEMIHGPGDETPHQGCICTRPFFGPHCEFKFTTLSEGKSTYKSTYKTAGPRMSMKAITGIYTTLSFLCVGGWAFFQTRYKGTVVEEYPGSTGIELS